MEDQNKGEESQQAMSPSNGVVGWGGKLLEEYRKIKEHAETYPYVWGSYMVVYGGFGLWFTYRWRKLRKTEDRVRTLQAKLRKLVEAEESASSATTSLQKAQTPPSDRVSK